MDHDEDRPPSLDESWAIIDEQRRQVRDTMRVDDRVVYTTWGVAWAVGYVAMYLSAGPDAEPGPLGATVFGTLLAAAVVVTVVHATRRTQGLGGDQARMDGMLGTAWPVAFLAVFAVSIGLGRAGLEGPATAIVYNGLPCLVVACLFMGSGAAWRDVRQFRLGVWIAAAVAVAALVGGSGLYLVMAVLGGGGFLVAAAVDAADRRTRRSAA